MSMFIKYRVHEVAKDFKMSSKDIAQILTEYATAPKNHMQVLEESELDIIFEYLTQHNQVEDLAEVFADTVPESKRQDEPSEKHQQNQPERQNSAVTNNQRHEQQKHEQKPKQEQKAEHHEHKPDIGKEKNTQENVQRPVRSVPEKRVIDTRGATVNIEKYD
ncbi:MAG: translation initiation factor IF-2, partial [Clostridiales bacterium]|nr:translation initiation factor IF-2 [Clostridiales bacterium]